MEIPCGRGCGPGWVDCTSTLPERILSLSTTSASGSIISSPRGYPMVNFGNGNGAGARNYYWRDIPSCTVRSLAWCLLLCCLGLRHAWGIMVVRTRASSGGSIEGCCGFPIWQGRQTLSVPACSEVVCRVGEHQHRWHIDVQNFTHT